MPFIGRKLRNMQHMRQVSCCMVTVILSVILSVIEFGDIVFLTHRVDVSQVYVWLTE